MANELLWKRLAGQINDGDGSEDSHTEFDHHLDDGAFIREITMEVRITGAEPDESGEVEITEVPAFIGSTNDTDFFIRSLTAGMPATGAGPPDSGDLIRNKTWKFARGQVHLKASKKYYVNVAKTLDGNTSYRIDIGYEEAD